MVKKKKTNILLLQKERQMWILYSANTHKPGQQVAERPEVQNKFKFAEHSAVEFRCTVIVHLHEIKKKIHDKSTVEKQQDH